MEDIQNYLQQHEALKAKGLRLTDGDIHTRIGIMDDVLDVNVESDSQVEELEDEYDDLYDTEIILNKANGDTELLAKSKARKTMKEKKDAIRVAKKTRNRSKNKAKVIDSYIFLANRVVK